MVSGPAPVFCRSSKARASQPIAEPGSAGALDVGGDVGMGEIKRFRPRPGNSPFLKA